ncbi:hypothetical protein Tco_1120038, partial [Tanacetum coccineum]
MSNYIKHMGSHTLQQLKRLCFDELKALFETTMRRVQTFHPIESEGDKTVPELTTGSSKRDAEVELDHEGSKKEKTNEASGGHDIFMLVEKDYPLTRGLLTLMLCNKMQVDQYSEMADELLRKIVILANRPRQWSRWRIEMETTVERFASRGWRWPATAVKRLEGFLKCEGVKGYSDQICTLPLTR